MCTQTASLSYFLLMFSTKTRWNWCATSRSYKNQNYIYSNTFLHMWIFANLSTFHDICKCFV